MRLRGFKRKKKYFLTKQGLDKLKKELEGLKELRLSKIKGDAPRSFRFGEVDPEFLAFQEDIGRLEERAAELKNALENHELIKIPPKNKQGQIYLGANVRLEMDGEIEEFRLVSTFEADPVNNKISDESPIGKALLGKRVGEAVRAKTAIVNHICKIIKIEYPKNNS